MCHMLVVIHYLWKRQCNALIMNLFTYLVIKNEFVGVLFFSINRFGDDDAVLIG